MKTCHIGADHEEANSSSANGERGNVGMENMLESITADKGLRDKVDV